MEKSQKQRLTAAIVALLVLVTAAVALFHLAARTEAQAGTLRIDTQEGTVYLPLADLPLEAVEGTLVNGKGEEKPVSGEGAPLAAVLAQAGVTAMEGVTVWADDEFSAFVTLAELEEADRAWLLAEADGTLRLAVFGDRDSKRSVKNVVRLEVV